MKRDPALQPLSHDHHEGLQFAARLRTSLRAGDDVAGLPAEDMVKDLRYCIRQDLDRDAVDLLLAELPALCLVTWLDASRGPDLLRRAARLAHGTGLAMADALILASLLGAGAETVYTTDHDFERYDGPANVIIL